MKPVISVIVPCYNIDAYLPKCIESILAQTMTDFELLLIDDGSLDNTLEVCQTYQKKDARIRIFTHPNQGVSYTRNKGILEANADILAFIDGDDYVKPDYLEKLYAAYQEGIWPICGMINVKKGKEIENVNYSQLLKRFSGHDIDNTNLLYLLKYDSFSSPCVRLYSRSIIQSNQLTFDTKVSYQEDLIFNVAYSQYIKRVKCINYFGYYYIEHSNSSSSAYHKHFDHLPALLQKLLPLVQNSEEKKILEEFFFHTILRKIINLFHAKSPLSDFKKYKELKALVQSEEYGYMKSYITKSKVNPVQKTLLRFRSTLLLFCYYKILH